MACEQLFKSNTSSLETALEQMKLKLLAEIDLALNPDDKAAQLTHDRASKYLYDLTLPDIINPHSPHAVGVVRDGTFEAVCMSLEGRGVQNPQDLSAYQFYKRIEIINSQNTKK